MKTKLFLFQFILILFFVNAVSAQCIRFNGNYASFPTSPLLRPVEQITVECWIKPEKYLKWAGPVSHLVDNKYNESGFALAFHDGEMRFMIKTDEMRSQDWNYNPGVELTMNQWCHIAGVYDGKSIRIYLNGVLSGERFVHGNIDWSFVPENLSIGAFVDNNELHHFDGCVDEVRIWNRALSELEIKNGMNVGLSGEEGGLLLYIPFTEDGMVIKDYSKNHFDGRVINYTSDNRVVSLAQTQPKLVSTELISSSVYKLKWSIPNQNEQVQNFYVDLAYDSKFITKLPGFSEIKTSENEISLENIPGGEVLYFRVKGKSVNNEFTAFSDYLTINEFSTSLTIDLISQGAKSNIHFIILDDNVLATEYYKFHSGTENVIINAVINSNSTLQDIRGTMLIEGGHLNEKYEIDRNSNLILSNLKPGEYEIALSWGTDREENLESHFVIEIDKFWWQNIWFIVIVLITISSIVFLGFRWLKLITRTKYDELLDGFMAIPEKDMSITQEEINDYYNQLVDLMNREKLYLEPRLNLKNIADRLDLTSNIVSNIIHEKYGHHFNDFINKFRIEEVKRQLKDKDSDNLKIVAIAYKCGFNSESTFFRVFKKYTGSTPSGYQRKLRKKE